MQYLPWEGVLVGGYILNLAASGLLKIRGDSGRRQEVDAQSPA